MVENDVLVQKKMPAKKIAGQYMVHINLVPKAFSAFKIAGRWGREIPGQGCQNTPRI